MSGAPKEVIIRTDQGRVVARMNLKDAALDGHCEWYDGAGELIFYGFFKDGAPFAGTFPNWTKFFSGPGAGGPYDPAVYCRDWVTFFETSFASEPPKYELVLEAYYGGREYTRRPAG